MRQPPATDSSPSTFALGVACGTATVLFWALGFVAAKYAVDNGLGPAELALHRTLWPALIFLPLLAIHGELDDLGGIGWGRGALLTVFGGVPFALLSAAGFMLVPLGHGGVIQPSCAALGGLVLSAVVLGEPMPATRIAGALAIVAGLMLLGWEALASIGAHAVLGDGTFAGAGISFAAFAMLLRLWRITPMRAVMTVSVLSLAYVPVYAAVFGFGRIVSAGWAANLLQAVAQGALAGTGATYLFTRTVVLLGASRAALFPALVPATTLLIGFLALGTVPSLVQVLGLAVVGVGFRLAVRG